MLMAGKYLVYLGKKKEVDHSKQTLKAKVFLKDFEANWSLTCCSVTLQGSSFFSDYQKVSENVATYRCVLRGNTHYAQTHTSNFGLNIKKCGFIGDIGAFTWAGLQLAGHPYLPSHPVRWAWITN